LGKFFFAGDLFNIRFGGIKWKQMSGNGKPMTGWKYIRKHGYLQEKPGVLSAWCTVSANTSAGTRLMAKHSRLEAISWRALTCAGSGSRRVNAGTLPLSKPISTISIFSSQRYPGLPRFLYGHSMGAILVLTYTPLRNPSVSGVIATAPGFKSALEEQKLKVFLAKVLGSVVPTITVKSGVDNSALSRDPKVVGEADNDPLCHSLTTVAWGKAMLRAIDLALKNAPRFPLPLLLMHGTKDEIAYPSGSQIFADLAPKDKVTLKMWEGFKHELHTDPEKGNVFRVMIDWLDAQLEGK
jgi:esterase/lipase